MGTVQKRVKQSSKAAAAIASVAGRKAAKKVAAAADTMLVKLGAAAKRRQQARKAKAAVKSVGKLALVLGAGAMTALAGKSVLARSGSRGRKRR